MAGDPSMEMMLQESGWEELRKEARKIEGDLDVKLSSYAKLGSRFTHPGSILFSLYIFMYLTVRSMLCITFADFNYFKVSGFMLH